jgi:hypothetical protein
MPNFDRSRKVWHDHIARWGGGALNGKIVRDGTTIRAATMAMSDYTPRERASLAIDGAVRFMVSAYQVSEANYVDFERDVIQFRGKEYKIAMKPSGQQPDGTWIGWDCPCLFVREL